MDVCVAWAIRVEEEARFGEAHVRLKLGTHGFTDQE
jgi:hypothetical protein